MNPKCEDSSPNRKTICHTIRMQTEKSIEIDRPIDAVFDYTTKNVAEWSIIVIEDRVIDEKPDGVGTTFLVVTEAGGRRMEFDGVVTKHEPPRAHTVLMKGKQFDINAEYRFEDPGDAMFHSQGQGISERDLFPVRLAHAQVELRCHGT